MSLENFNKTLDLFIVNNIFKDPYKRNRVIATLILLLIDVFATSFLSYNSKIIVDSLFANKLHNHNILIIISLLVVCLILTKIIIHIQEIIFFPVINLTVRDVTYKVIEHLHNISLIRYQQLSLQEVMNSIRRISISARAFIKTLVLAVIPAIIKLSITVVIIVKLGSYSLLWFFALIMAVFILYKSTKSYMLARKDAWQITDQVMARIHDSILNTKMIRSCEAIEMQQIMELLNKEADCWQQTNNKLHLAYIKVFLILGLGIALVLSGVVYYVEQSRLTVGDFVFLKAHLISALVPFKHFTLQFRKIAESLVDIRKILEILQIPKKSNYICVHTKNNTNKSIVFNNITFSYPDKKPILENFSLSVSTGEKVIINGKNGSGKSTLVNLMAGLYSPEKGQIFVQGQNIQHINKTELSSIIYCIQQDVRLLNNSLFYNISYGIKDCTRENLNNMLTEFKFVDFIQQLPLGLETQVGDMGSHLSVGERQKIAILRALLVKPDILILDETTNSLSGKDEQHILNLLCSYIPTIIIVSHRTIALDCRTRIINMETVKNNSSCKVAVSC